jgi:hypothetical protein
VAPRRNPHLWFAAALLSFLTASLPARAEQLDNLGDVLERLRSCWQPPPKGRANPIDITVIVSFTRAGAILGHPKISYESDEATDNDRLMYRIAVMETLQRYAPMPFTEGLGGAVAGRPFAIRFGIRKLSPKPAEKRAWLTPKIL